MKKRVPQMEEGQVFRLLPNLGQTGTKQGTLIAIREVSALGDEEF